MKKSLPALLVVVIGLAVYWNSFGGVLVFDDVPAIVTNVNIRSLLPLSRAMSARSDTTLSGRPIASLTFALDYAVGVHRVWGYHATNLAIHLLAALTLFGIVRRTLLTERMRDQFGSHSAALALAVALVWLVHPLQTASVTYVVQRVESLMGLFYLLTLYCAIRANEDYAQRWWIAGAAAACAAGMGTKEVMVTAPFMVLLWDVIFAPRSGWSRRWPLYASLAATWAIVAVLAAGAPRARSVGFGFAGWPWWRYLLTQAGVITHYLRLTIVPTSLVLDYQWPPVQSILEVVPQLTLVVVLFVSTVWAVVRRLPLGFAGAWFFGILAPSSSVLPIVTEVAADHRMYLPLAAIVSLIVIGGYALVSRKIPAGVLAFAAGGVVVVFAILSNARNRDYQSSDGIWLDTIQKRPLNTRARDYYGSVLLSRGEFANAEPHLRVVVQANPDFVAAQSDLGAALCGLGKLEEGLSHLLQAVAIRPDYWPAQQNLGEAYAFQGQLWLALKHFASALAQQPNNVPLLNRTAWILATAPNDYIRNGAEAVVSAERAVRLTHRHDVASLDTLAAAYAEVDRFDQAIAVGEEAVTLARASGNRTDLQELEQRLASYRTHQKVRTPMPRPPRTFAVIVAKSSDM